MILDHHLYPHRPVIVITIISTYRCILKHVRIIETTGAQEVAKENGG